MSPGAPAEGELMRLLTVDAETMVAAPALAGIARWNDAPRPRLCLAGCSVGDVVRVREDMDDRLARDLVALVRAEPPWADPDVEPQCIEAVLDLLAPGAVVTANILYSLRHDLAYAAGARMICGDTAEGEALLARLERQGMPRALLDAGFLSVGDFWDPWCAALVGEEIAAMAFAACLGERGAEVGVYTFPGFRSQGLAAAVTARWSRLDSLAGRDLFYSTSSANLSSQRVAERLDLPRLGVRLAIG
jgi:hypothetical protein